MLFSGKDFYPTPETLLYKITAGVDWSMIKTVLEPSAGKGNIAEYVKTRCQNHHYGGDVDIDCIEIDETLRCTLTGKELRVVHDDFLTFKTYKQYDLIFMNPPFSTGATHLLKALDIQKCGGSIICILNAETIRNPYSNERKMLVQKLEELQADIQYYENEFKTAENPTGVEIAVVRVSIQKEMPESAIYESLRKKTYKEYSTQEMADLAPNDYIEAAIAQYNLEVESGIKLIEEYQAMAPHILNSLDASDRYRKPVITLEVGGHDLSTNRFVRLIRAKYWTALFENRKFTGPMTSELREKYRHKVRELADYDFSYYNIKTLQVEMSKELISGIEECIVKLFDKLSYQYHYSDELCKNIHYYNGWKTNKSWYINSKVVIPFVRAYCQWSGKYEPDSYEVVEQLLDIEKALNYLDGGLTYGNNLHYALQQAKESGQTKKIRLKYFLVTFYKKGTMHIEFTNAELLKKLNIFGSQQKKWLPPSYGKKTYAEMDSEERAVVDEFEGKEEYEKTLNKADYFIYSPESSLPALDMAV